MSVLKHFNTVSLRTTLYPILTEIYDIEMKQDLFNLATIFMDNQNKTVKIQVPTSKSDLMK